MAEVTVMHSVVIKATGSTATETLDFDAISRLPGCGIWESEVPGSLMVEDGRPRIADSRESTVCPDVGRPGTGSSSLMLYGARNMAIVLKNREVASQGFRTGLTTKNPAE
jgi:hypothetical protein